MFVLDPPCPKWPQEWAHFPGHRAMDASPSAMLRYREHQRLTERTQSKLRVDSTPREVFAHWVSTRAFHTRSRSRSPAGRTLLPQWRVSRHSGSLMGHLSFTELLGDIVHRSLPLRRLIRDYRPCSAAGPVRLGATPLPIQCHSPRQRLVPPAGATAGSLKALLARQIIAGGIPA